MAVYFINNVQESVIVSIIIFSKEKKATLVCIKLDKFQHQLQSRNYKHTTKFIRLEEIQILHHCVL